MKKRILIISLILFTLSSFIAFGYFSYKLYYYIIIDEKSTPTKEEAANTDSLNTFSSSKEFDDFVDELAKETTNQVNEKESYGMGDTAAPAESNIQSESITNVQEQGVDEGDIVKAYKDYLIILRRGRLFTVSLEGNTIKPKFQTNAYPEGFTQGTWYDEMLISDNTLIVVGYSYKLSATEINIFTIEENGTIHHLESYYIDSNDYYSSRNYTSRLVDGELVFYMPYYLFRWDYDYDNEEYIVEASLPKVKKWKKGNEITNGRNLIEKTDIYKPVQDVENSTLHTVVRCNVNTGFDCNSKAVLGPYSRNFYVTDKNIYLWISEMSNYWYYSDEDRKDQKEDAYVYQIKTNDLSARVLQADGTPIDQFSFKEDDEFLNVLVRENSTGDAMWNSQSTSGEVALFRTRLENFTKEPKVVAKDDFTELETPEGYTLQNRFVNDFLLYGTGSNWYYDETSEDFVYVVDYKSPKKLQKVNLDHSVDRIEVLGQNATVVGADDNNLYISSIDLSLNSEVADSKEFKNAFQGETRSHGFFYKKYDDYGILGLPIRSAGNYYDELYKESARIVYLKVENDISFSELESLDSSGGDRVEDDCKASCVDWYGNSRPIFYQDRIFALMGYELIEGEIDSDKIVTKEKVYFYQE